VGQGHRQRELPKKIFDPADCDAELWRPLRNRLHSDIDPFVYQIFWAPQHSWSPHAMSTSVVLSIAKTRQLQERCRGGVSVDVDTWVVLTTRYRAMMIGETVHRYGGSPVSGAGMVKFSFNCKRYLHNQRCHFTEASHVPSKPA
jgi:hypothetical protein